ncbi:MAG: hypothetical protein HKL86_03100 [Acidimicrobiaceae bacterium]|nr:hypothetical protein [Acidimicrobiaceae bacterium]
MNRAGKLARLIAALVVALGLGAATFGPELTASAGPAWQVAWTSPMDLNIGYTQNSTVRDIATVPVSATSIELTFSNLWSKTPTTFIGVTVGVVQSGVNVVPGTFRPVTFNAGSRQVTMAPGAQVTSDPVAMIVRAGETISVSIAVSGWAVVSAHTCCYGNTDTWATSNNVGNLTTSPTATGFNPLLTGAYIRWLTGISVAGSPAIGSIVAFGDSITDGYGYTNNGFSWVTALQRRISLLPPDQQVSVVNEGIAGNTIAAFPPRTSYEETSGGLAGVTRFSTDALAWPGVRDVLVLLGTNDIWFGAGGLGKPVPPYGTPLSIEGAMRQIIVQAHAKHVKIYGITLLPRATSTAADHDQPEYWGPQEQAVLQAVNTWMLSGTSGFDGVIDLGAVMGDVYNGACSPTVPFAPYFNPDHLHPNVAGETAIGDAISTALFGLAQAPQIPQLVSVTPTAGCAAARTAATVLAAGTAPGTTTTTSTTSTVPATTTTKPPVGLLSRVDSSKYLWLALALTMLVAILSARRRQLRRRAEARRRALRPTNYPRVPPPAPPRRSPGSPPAPKRQPPRR